MQRKHHVAILIHPHNKPFITCYCVYTLLYKSHLNKEI